MLPSQKNNMRALFSAVVELPQAERAAFLDEHCTDPALRAQIMNLLAAYYAAGERGFLPEPPATGARTIGELLAAAGATLRLDPLPGSRIGRYHIKSLIGAGGMSRVYEAVQEEPHRVVALKVMNPHATARSAFRRFRYESQVLGRMRHPHIAQVFEAGTAMIELPVSSADVVPTAGNDAPPPRSHGGPHARPRTGVVEVPFFAMEYISGARPITRFAHEKSLDTRSRVDVFIKICDAVHYGHQRGVIHRDLKPANLLVDAAGEPKVIDFGVARGIDSDIALTTQQTRLGDLVGTIQYMSPEQCDGDPHDIDTRSDVYSLGIVLYELLTGRLPYEVADSTIYQAARIIREHPPARPSGTAGIEKRVVRRLRGDLDTIILKAIEKDRDRRYASAAALAEDLRRYLAHEPILARAPTVWSRVLRWAYRRPARTMLIVSAAANIALLAGGVFGANFFGWYWSRQPARVEAADNGVELRLFARNGLQIFTSARASTSLYRFAEILQPAQATNPRRPLIVGLALADRSAGHFEKGLNIFDADQFPGGPRLVRNVDADLIPTILTERRDARFEPGAFGVVAGLVADVFPELPGDEVVVAFQHGSSTQTAIVIFDLEWRQRYCVWNDGLVVGLYWMSDAKQLVIAGCNGRYSLPERGLDFATAPNRPGATPTHPFVVFAVRPRLDFRTKFYVAQEPDEKEAADEPLRPVWHWMLPTTPLAEPLILRAPDDRDPNRFVSLEFVVRGRSPHAHYSVIWTLDDQGRADGEPRFGDTYGQYLRGERSGFEGIQIPGTDHWKLEPLPPVLPKYRRPAGSQSPPE